MAKSNHWIKRIADQVEQYAVRKKGEGAEIVCASGISPSGVIHLGNLREIMTVHLVTEELKRRGKAAVHLHFWDDYDRFRKVPANIAPELFPAEVRALGVGLPYALTVAIFGGSAEYIALYLKKIGHEHWFYWFVTGCIAISLIVYLTMRDTRRTSLIDKD